MDFKNLLKVLAISVTISVCLADSKDWFSFLGCIYVRRQDCFEYGNSAECGTDAVTYRNRCDFSKAQCDNPSLHLAHLGSCKPNSLTNPQSTAKPVVTGSTMSIGMTSDTPMVTGASMTTSAAATTSAPYLQGSEAVLDFFCLQLSHDACLPDVDPICGSDNMTYDNSCEFEKQRCTHRNLRVSHFGKCNTV